MARGGKRPGAGRKPKAPPLTLDEIKEAADRAEELKPEKRANGRPSSYREPFAKQAEKLCALGATDDDLADFFEVSVRTVLRWKVEFPAFCQALKDGKAGADDRVERSLYQRAVGYSHDAEKIMQHQGEVVRAAYREHYPPDTTAAIFWLKNRRPEQWRDKVAHEHKGEITIVLDKVDAEA
ncbi:hypothetical protein LRS73_26845 [Methylobacterium currus]|uniref:hypothetical protein n=1 Tax=Methylobacterium currus TaxID=2051553 RepID=UPI001E34FAAA|nr:hypothetical protein [Methylobacterium currus]UHC16054.1 hypothetical protein LRS73_26845 [Methylobacterium currus]